MVPSSCTRCSTNKIYISFLVCILVLLAIDILVDLSFNHCARDDIGLHITVIVPEYSKCDSILLVSLTFLLFCSNSNIVLLIIIQFSFCLGEVFILHFLDFLNSFFKTGRRGNWEKGCSGGRKRGTLRRKRKKTTSISWFTLLLSLHLSSASWFSLACAVGWANWSESWAGRACSGFPGWPVHYLLWVQVALVVVLCCPGRQLAGLCHQQWCSLVTKIACEFPDQLIVLFELFN